MALDQAKIDFSQNKMVLKGVFSFETVLPIYESGISFIQQQTFSLSPLEIDLSQLTKSDSSGLAVFLGWMRAAKQKNITLHFSNVPKYLLDVARLCGIENILPI